MINIIQINLHHSKAASAALLLRLAKSGEEVVLIQEPWINDNKICGLRAKGYTLLFAGSLERSRSCILVKNNLSVFLLPQFCSGDVTVACIETGRTRTWLAAVYMDGEKTIPPDNLGELVSEAQRRRFGVILGCDANAHHTVWGSSDINERGESLFEYLLSTNLIISNIGQEPTFVVRNRQEVLDVTLVSDFMSSMIREWRVSEEHSFSDHRYITFKLSLRTVNQCVFRNPRRTAWSIYRAELEDRIPSRTPNPPVTEMDLDSMVDTISAACNSSLRAACPLTRVRGKPRPVWWTAALADNRKGCGAAFNKAKKTRNSQDWDVYKERLKVYKRELRKARRSSWRRFCDQMEGVSETSRLRKILSTNPTVPGYLIKPDGKWTVSSEETLNLLMETHFPGSEEATIGVPGSDYGTHSLNAEHLLDRRKIRWAIKSFKPFKSAGPDGIVPAEIQRNSEILLPWLETIYKGCLRLGYIPKMWREARVIFIPKAGRSSHSNPKDLRPISLSSFLLKILERLVEVYIRSKIEPRKWAQSQHAYQKGKSVDTALHVLVRGIEKSLNYQEFSLVAFLDIEGAFNNVKVEAIKEGLLLLDIEHSVTRLINHMLGSRMVSAVMGEVSVRRRVVRGTPQGGVLSPLLWNIVINGLLLELEGMGINVVAYADDVAIAVSGKHLDTIRDVMQSALSITANWASKCGLGINPSKTELVPFTRKYKIPVVTPPSLNGTRLVFTEKARFLGILLDSKLSWKLNTMERVKKATVALYSCKNAIGKKWGLSPRLVHWLYTAVVRPILLYGVSVWWPALEKLSYKKLMERVQRTACLLISGALKTTPTCALEVMLHLLPLDIIGKQMATNTAVRLSAASEWKCLQKGHSTIVSSLKQELVNTDYMIPRLSFDKRFRVSIPSREDWEHGFIMETGVVKFFTDGSRLDGRVGAGVFCEELNVNVSVRLPDHCSVYQAEVLAIEEVMNWLRHNTISVIDIVIYVDSQAALLSLDSVSLTSKMALSCHSSLNEMGDHFNIQLIWVPGHSDVRGNCRADELARCGTNLQLEPGREKMGKPLAVLKAANQKKAFALANSRWLENPKGRVAKQVWPELDLRRSETLITLRRSDLRRILGILTGHSLFGNHARRLGLVVNDFCRSCRDEEEEETLVHFLCSCPALAGKRHDHLGRYTMDSLSDIRSLNVRNLLRYLNSTGWV